MPLTSGAPRVMVWAWLALVPLAEVSAQIGFRQVTSTHPVAVQRGQSAVVALRSNFTLDETFAVFSDRPAVSFTFLETALIEAPRRGRGSAGAPFRFLVEVPEDELPGVCEYRVATRQAVSSVAQLLITDFPVVMEGETENGTDAKAQPVELPAAICGICDRFEDVDCFRFEGRAGQPLTCEVFAQRVTDRIHGMVVRGPRIYLMDPIVTLRGPRGQTVAQNDNWFGGDSLLECRLPLDGTYTLEVRDARYAGDPRYSYCLEVSCRPFVHGVFPLVSGSRYGEVELIGAVDASRVRQPLPAVASGWSRARFETGRGPSNPVWVGRSDLPLVLETEPNDKPEQATPVSAPAGVNGRLDAAGDIDFFRLPARQGERLRFELQGRRRGSPIDSVIELYSPDGKRLAEADDLDAKQTKDSRLFWTANADGDVLVAVRDLHDRGGERFVYHLQIEPALPDFELFGEYYYAMLAPGTNMMWFARIERHNGFDGPVAIEVEGLPPGVTAVPTCIPAGMNHCGVILQAEKEATLGAALVRVRGRATIEVDGQSREIVRDGLVTCEQQSSGGGQSRWPIATQVVGVTRPLDLRRVVASPEEIALAPGESVELKVRIERAEGFDEAVTLATAFQYFTTTFGDQLPPGVSMSSKSRARLSGDNVEGTIILEAAEDALPVERLPIAVLARVSITFSITTNYASNPVYLTVTPAREGKVTE